MRNPLIEAAESDDERKKLRNIYNMFTADDSTLRCVPSLIEETEQVLGAADGGSERSSGGRSWTKAAGGGKKKSTGTSSASTAPAASDAASASLAPKKKGVKKST